MWTDTAREVWPNATFVLFEGIDFLEFLYDGYLHHMGPLSDSKKIVKWYQHEFHVGGSSYHKEIGLGSHSDEVYPRDNFILKNASTLDQVVRENGFPLPDFIKIDVQGCKWTNSSFTIEFKCYQHSSNKMNMIAY